MRLHLIRHGETNWNAERRVQGQSESRLSDNGIEQARALGGRIGAIAFDAVYCSSSRRTRETVQNCLPRDKYRITYQDQLREIFMGPWEGRLYDEIAGAETESFHHFWHEPHKFRVDGAETFLDLQQRALAAITAIAAQHRNREIAMVSHGAFIKSVLCHAAGRPISELWAPPPLHNCAHSIIELNKDDTWRIMQVADKPVRANQSDQGS